MKKLGAVLYEAIISFFKKPVTSEYPYKKRTIHKSYAGMISFEQKKCIGCQICVRNCPSNAIKITKVAEKVFSCELSLVNCIFCSQCVFSCPKKALHTTDNFELAEIDKSKLTVKLEDLNPEAKMTKEDIAALEAAAAKAKEAALAAVKAKQQEQAAAKTKTLEENKSKQNAEKNTAKSSDNTTEKVPKDKAKADKASDQNPVQLDLDNK